MDLEADCRDILARAAKYEDKPHQLWNGLRLLALKFGDVRLAAEMDGLYLNPPKIGGLTPKVEGALFRYGDAYVLDIDGTAEEVEAKIGFGTKERLYVKAAVVIDETSHPT